MGFAAISAQAWNYPQPIVNNLWLQYSVPCAPAAFMAETYIQLSLLYININRNLLIIAEWAIVSISFAMH